MNIAFKPILNLEIWHDYYLGQPDELDVLPAQYNISEAIALIPTLECQSILRNLRWLIRGQPYGAVVLAHVDPTADSANSEATGLKPIVPIDENARLTFWLVVRDRNFANYTNLSLDAPLNQIYYFSNRSGNQAGDSHRNGNTERLFLSQSLDSYTSGAEYSLGQLVTYKNKQGMMTLEAAQYQAKARRSPKLIDSTELGNNTAEDSANSRSGRSAEWIRLPSSQYVSSKDYLSRQGLSRLEAIASANPGDNFRFSLVNLNQQETFSLAGQVPDTHPTGAALPVNLNFAGQHPGYYQLLRNGERIDEFVLFDPMAGRDALALIEISLNPFVLPSSFRLLDLDGELPQLRPKTYRIRFKNRATHWRYHCDRPHGFTTESLPTTLQLIDAQTYATKYPVGLCRQPKRLLTDGNNRLLPAPSVSMIKPQIETKSDGSRTVTAIFSDTYL